MARTASTAERAMEMFDLSSDAPRARTRPSRTMGSKGARLPLVERVDRLDVVVAVEEHGRRSDRVEPVGIDDRVAARLADLDVLQARRQQVGGQLLGGPPAVRGVLGDPADAGDPQEVQVAGEAPLGGRVQVGRQGAGRCRDRHGVLHCWGVPAVRPARRSAVRRCPDRPGRRLQAGCGAGTESSFGTTPWMGSFGGRSAKSASNSVASSVSRSTSFAASASSLSR